MIPLPPKRFQPAQDDRFNVLKHKPWYKNLTKRRAKLPLLKAARENMVRDGASQIDAASMYGVDERELRDYCDYIDSIGPRVSQTLQHIMDDAYGHYVAENAKHHIRHYLAIQAPFYGLNPRHIVEEWEVNRTYYPTNYRG